MTQNLKTNERKKSGRRDSSIGRRDLRSEKAHPNKFYLCWITQNIFSCNWVTNLLVTINEKDILNIFEIDRYITRTLAKNIIPLNILYIALDLNFKKTKECLHTGLNNMIHYDRPKWIDYFKDIRDANER